MPLSNLIKKAMAFAVTILCSLTSIGLVGSTKSKENPPMMHDSLYASWVATAYNALPNNPDIELCLDGFYAPVYFSNLRTNFGTNRFGTCAFVAMGMLLSFYDTYWDDSIVPDAYEVAARSYGDPINGSVDSPGSSDSALEMTDYTTFDQYMSSGVPALEGSRLDAKLISMAMSYSITVKQDVNEAGLDYSGMYSLFQYYLYTYRGFSPYELGFIAETGTGTGQARSESVRDFAIEKVSEGIPVLLSVGTDYSQITGRHAVIAYDYDDGNDLLYCHMGWGPKATHVTIESFGYTSYNSAFSLAVRTSHNCSNNYKKIDQWENTISTHCACRFAAPYDIKAVDWHRNEEPGFEWSCVDKEGWFGDFIKYDLNILNCSNETINNGEKKWALKWQEKISSQGAYDTFNQSPVSVTMSVEYDDGYHNISSISRSATFPWITDFSGAHNVHPGDYAYSPNTPMTTAEATHNIDGLSFKTNRKGVYEESDMVSLLYAGSGFNDSYIKYSNFPDGDSVIGVDFGIRLWEGTNATHGLSIDYYDGSSWQVGPDLLGSDYDIAGSNGAVRWIHHSFGTPVSAFVRPRIMAT